MPIAIADLQRADRYVVIDDGENIVGTMDAAGHYHGFGPHFPTPYPSARPLLFAAEVLVVFSGDHPDVDAIATKMGCADWERALLRAKTHRVNWFKWGDIYGKCLRDMCEELYPGHRLPEKPVEIPEPLAPSDYGYVLDNYWDVYQTRMLWEAFRAGRITLNQDCLASGRYC